MESVNTKVLLLTEPADGVPSVTDTWDGLAAAMNSLAAGSGPLSVDTERAHGFRYAPKAYLIQLRRAAAGTFLIDPIAFEAGEPRADFSELAAALASTEWIIHAASQDLPCLAEVKLLPHKLFDTELAARLLNLPKVNLNTVTETALGISLRKEHSASDWSGRPLPKSWLNYAALDVELLAELREWLDDQLREAGKREWAAQEFEYLVAHANDPHVKRPDPWRRTSGLNYVHSIRGLAVVRELWLTRDVIAATLDLAPGRILKDRSIISLAAKFDKASPRVDRLLLRNEPGFLQKNAVRYEKNWFEAVERAASLTTKELPTRNAPTPGIPKPRNWERRAPDSFARWERVRAAVVTRAEELQLPVENLISGDALRNLLWESEPTIDTATIAAKLAASQARPWQIEQLTKTILNAW